MQQVLPVASLTIHQLAIPFVKRFRHAAAERTTAEPIIVALELADRTIGFGETHARPYVTGEDSQEVLDTIQNLLAPLLVEFRPSSFPEALEAIAALPQTHPDTGKPITAARAAVELALLDAYGRAFERSIETIAGWLGEPGLTAGGAYNGPRYSGVLSAENPGRVAWSVRKMRLYGLRDFKLKVGDAQEADRLEAVTRVLSRPLASKKVTLRLDVNAAWDYDTALRRLHDWRSLPITCVEQPLPRGQEEDAAKLERAAHLPIMADESLVTLDDAENLIVHRAASWFNIRIAKNGGLIPSLRLAATARRHHIQFQLGCLVGETSILSAAGRWFLQMTTGIRFAEGSYGKLLLSADVLRKPVQFGFGGSWKPLTGPGLGIEVDADALARHAADRPFHLPL